MSLQVWLPLNGNLQQQGLSGVNATTMGTGITYSTGKIGQAATFPNNCNSCIYLPRLRLQTGTYAAWIKVIGSGATARQCIISEGRDSSNDGVEIYTNQAGTSLNFKAHEKIITTTISLNQWYHVAGTFGDGEIKLYINGTLVGSNTYTADMSYQYALDLVLGKMSYSYTNTSNYFAFNGQLNDVRIYDHALSAKEVEEISKGLVLHYKLDNIIQPNLLSGNPNLINAWVQDGIALTQESDNSLKCVVTANTKRIYNNVSNVWTTVGNIYTVSFLAKAQTNGIEIRASRSIADYAPTFTLTTDWKYYSAQITITATSTGGTLSIQGINNGDTFWLRNIKLEKGNIATHYLLPNNMINIVYDSSGYNNNGTVVGPLEITTSSSRYSCATKFDGVTSCIKIPYNEINPDRIFTVNLWFYKDALGSKGYETLFGGPSGFEMDTRAGSATSLSLYMASVRGGNVYSPLNLNKWTMITMARDGTNEFYYVNGELKKTIEAKSMPSGQYRIGAWASDTGQNYYGEISDFRIYATVLTAEQIKELYNTSMTIDNQGNIHVRELVE